MKLYDWKNFKGGWFVGNFVPSIFPTDDVEVSIKRYKAGDYDPIHYHKEADEITMIVSGTVTMFGAIYEADQIIWIEKGDQTDFLAMTDAVTCVIKLPCVKGDKYEL